MELTDRRPVLYADDAFKLTLAVERTEADDGRLIMDDGTIRRFLDWQNEVDIYPFQGGGSGPGFWTGTFPLRYKEDILQWCTQEGLIDG